MQVLRLHQWSTRKDDPGRCSHTPKCTNWSDASRCRSTSRLTSASSSPLCCTWQKPKSRYGFRIDATRTRDSSWSRPDSLPRDAKISRTAHHWSVLLSQLTSNSRIFQWPQFHHSASVLLPLQQFHIHTPTSAHLMVTSATPPHLWNRTFRPSQVLSIILLLQPLSLHSLLLDQIPCHPISHFLTLFLTLSKCLLNSEHLIMHLCLCHNFSHSLYHFLWPLNNSTHIYNYISCIQLSHHFDSHHCRKIVNIKFSWHIIALTLQLNLVPVLHVKVLCCLGLC